MKTNFSSGIENITKVADINPYNANNISLRLRVDNKTPIRTYCNAKGEGRTFSVDLVDDTGEIKCTFFNESVDQFAPLFEVGKVFVITKAGIKPGNPKFCRTPYEMTINRNTTITEVDAPKQSFSRRYNFIPSIDAIQDLTKDTMIDCIGVMIDVGTAQPFTTKDGKNIVKKLIRIADQSDRNVEVTLWNDTATNFYGSVGSVLAIKSGKINEFKGEKNITSISSTLFEIDPDLPEASELSNWYSQNADFISTTSHSLSHNSQSSTGSKFINSNIETLASLQEQFNNSFDKKSPIYTKVKGTLIWINHDDRAPLFYKSCPDNPKKVIENTHGNGKKWLCEATGQYYDSYNCRYILSTIIGDITGSQFVTIFDKEGEVILGGQTAKDIEALKLNGDLSKLNFVFEDALFKRYLFTIKATEEMYQDEVKLRCTIAGIEKINYIEESKRLIDEIGSML